MFYDQGCHGVVELGELPRHVRLRLASLPGEWLEFDPPSGSIVVRHIEPSTRPSLPTIVGELVHRLSEIPADLHKGIPGGDLFVHTEDTGQLARVRVEAGGAVHIHWAHPDYARARRRPYSGAAETSIEPWAQCLNGVITFAAADPDGAASELLTLADTFDGLYPEGDCAATRSDQTVRLEMKDLNLDSHLLVRRLTELALPRSLEGRIVVTSFGEAQPEANIRFMFQDGQIWVQRPLLWEDAV
jgi:hypothetical protein